MAWGGAAGALLPAPPRPQQPWPPALPAAGAGGGASAESWSHRGGAALRFPCGAGSSRPAPPAARQVVCLAGLCGFLGSDSQGRRLHGRRRPPGRRRGHLCRHAEETKSLGSTQAPPQQRRAAPATVARPVRGVPFEAAAPEENRQPPAELLGVPLTPDILAVGLVYFAQGALGLAALAKPFFLKDDLQLPPAEASLLLSLTYWPWALKPAWGFIADSFPILGSRRRAYLLGAGIVSAAGWFGLSAVAPGESKELVLLLMMLGNFGIAFSDVVVDGLVVEKARDDARLMGGLQSYSWACRGVGAVLSAYLSGVLLEAWGARGVFGATAVLPLLVSAAAVLVKEEERLRPPAVDESPLAAVREQVSQLWDVVTSPKVFPPLCFIALWQMTPNAGSAMFYFYTNSLGFSPEFLGRNQLAGALATLAGIFWYNRAFAATPLRQYLFWVNVAAAAVGLLPLLLVTRANLSLGIPDQLFVLGDDVIQTVAGELAHMPVLVLAARLCPPGIEATVFALLMSVLNLSGLLSSALGSWLTGALQVTEADFSNLALLLLLCNVSGLLPLLLLNQVPGDDEEASQGEKGSAA